MNRVFALCLALAAGLLLVPAAQAADPASLDIGFGDGGRVRLGGPGEPMLIASLAAGAGGSRSIVATGAAADASLVARFHDSGLPDLGFGTNGLVRFPHMGAPARLPAPLADGRTLLIVGDTTVARLLPDGRRDWSVIVPDSATLAGLVAGEDGSAVVLATDHVLTRIRPDGTVDETFAPEAFAPSGSSAVGLLPRPAGGFVVVSTRPAEPAHGEGETILTALDGSGRLDRSYGRQGIASFFGLVSFNEAVGPSGAIAVAGQDLCDSTAGGLCSQLGRVDARGVSAPPLQLVRRADLVAFDAQDRLISVATTGSSAARITRLLPSGARDNAFGSCGTATIPSAGPGTLTSIVVLPTGRIVLGGRLSSGSLLLTALRGTGRHDPDGAPTADVRPHVARLARGRFVFRIRSAERAQLRSRLLLSAADARRLGVPRVQSTATGRVGACALTTVNLRLRPAISRRLGRGARLVVRTTLRNAAGRRSGQVSVRRGRTS